MNIILDCSDNRSAIKNTKHITELANALSRPRSNGSNRVLDENLATHILATNTVMPNMRTTLLGSSSDVTLEQLYSMSNKSLRDILVKHKLKKSGNKKELANRIWNFNSRESFTIRDVPFNAVEDSDDDGSIAENQSIYSLIDNKVVLFMNNDFEICSEHYVPAPTEVLLVPIKNWVFIEAHDHFEYVGLAIATSTGNYIDLHIIPPGLRRFSQ